MNNLLNSKFTADKILNVQIEDDIITSYTLRGSPEIENIWTGVSHFSISFIDGDLSIKTTGREEREQMIEFIRSWLDRTKFKVEDV